MVSNALSPKMFGALHPEDVEWQPYAGFPVGVQSAILVGDPTQPGPYVIRVKVPEGIQLVPHWHPEDRVYTVVSGVFYIGLGETFDETKLIAYAPGSVVVLPGHTAHFHWARSGEYISQVQAMGPFGLNFF